MTIKKFSGKTKDDATAKARQELGEGVVIMNVREIKPTGLFKAFKSSTFEVTAAVDDNKMSSSDIRRATGASLGTTGKIDLTANEDISSILRQIPQQQLAQAMQELTAQQAQTQQPQMQQAQTQQPQIRQQVQYNTQQLQPKSSILQTETNTQQPKYTHRPQQMGGFEEKLESLQSLLEERLTPQQQEEVKLSMEESMEQLTEDTENAKFVKMVYNMLLDNEVDEKYANQLLTELDKTLSKTSSVEMSLANIYQKMILKFGQPNPIDLTGVRPKVIFFIGPTGVGKTTTVAKIASKLKVESGKKIALLTADAYRIAAEEQLRTYANILETPLTIIYSADELAQAIENVKDVDVVLVDTAGFSHKSAQQKENIKYLIKSLPEEYPKEVFLVLSATTKYRDLLQITDTYKEIADYKMIFTKLDETLAFGNLYNLKMYTGADMSYVTVGQNVPDDIEVFDTQQFVKKLLGGK